MIQRRGIVRRSARHIAKAVQRTVDAYGDGRVEHETDFTSRMLANIEEAMNGFRIKGVQWRAKVLTDRGPHSQEHMFGADFLGVLEIKCADYMVRKGFLAQAKRAEQLRIEDLRDQCSKMLEHSPDAFVFLYDRSGVTVVPAISVISCSISPTQLYARSVARFFEDHLECFIGDHRITALDARGLEKLRHDVKARSLLHLRAEDSIEVLALPS